MENIKYKETFDDFYNFVNKEWEKNNKIPKDYSKWGTFEILDKQNKKKIKKILITKNRGDKFTTESKIINILYNSGMNIKKINNDKLDHIKIYIDKVNNIKSNKDLIYVLSLFHSIGLNPLFDFNISPDSKNTKKNILHLYHNGINLPDKEYYLKKKHKDILSKYKKYIEDIFILSGLYKYCSSKLKSSIQCVAQSMAEDVIEFETQLAKNIYDIEKRRNSDITYNKILFNEFNKKTKNFDYKEFLLIINSLINNSKKNIFTFKLFYIIIDNPQFFIFISNIIQNNDSKQQYRKWKSYLLFILLNNTAPFLSNDFQTLNFNFYSKILRGQEKNKPRWELVSNLISSSIGEIIGKIYIHEYGNEKIIKKIENMNNKFKLIFIEMVKELEWMSKETKNRVFKKIKKINIKVGYPKKWGNKDYKKILDNKLFGNSYLQNIILLNKFNLFYILNKLNKSVDKNEWQMNVFTVNAYHDSQFNDIVFPLAILQKPFFDINQSDYKNYAGIGSIIGHEIIHAFDDEGMKYEENGNLNNLWTKKDEKLYKKEAKKIVNQYNNYTIYGNRINGSLTQGENIADLGGVKIALKAFIKYKNIQNNNNLTKLFFIHWAFVEKSLIKKEYLIKRLIDNPHSPNKYRVNGIVPNLDEFYEVFDIQKNNKLYIDKKKRVNLW